MTNPILPHEYPEIFYLGAYLIPANLDVELRGYVVANGIQRTERLIKELDDLLTAPYTQAQLRYFLRDTMSSAYLVANNPRATFVYFRANLSRLVREAYQAEKGAFRAG
ncbi:hypothetical protein BAC2_03838 [uncultured bacterium]|nr:hypothetical protein BAC2_03838 [uncultured bacterium]